MVVRLGLVMSALKMSSKLEQRVPAQGVHPGGRRSGEVGQRPVAQFLQVVQCGVQAGGDVGRDRGHVGHGPVDQYQVLGPGEFEDLPVVEPGRDQDQAVHCGLQSFGGGEFGVGRLLGLGQDRGAALCRGDPLGAADEVEVVRVGDVGQQQGEGSARAIGLSR